MAATEIVPAKIVKGVNDLEKVVPREAGGSSFELYLYGAQVTSWKNKKGVEILFASSKMLLLLMLSCLTLMSPASALPESRGCILRQRDLFCPVVDDVCPADMYCRESSIDDYVLLKPLGRGGFGSTWTATRWDGETVKYVIKKIQVGGNNQSLTSGRREKYFGEIFETIHRDGRDHVGRYVESFITREEMIIVSLYEGSSLFSFLYETIELNGRVDNTPSVWSRWLRKTSRGRELMRIMFYQMLSGLRYFHGLGIIHRDIKPENIVVCFTKSESSCSSQEIPIRRRIKFINLRFIDFGSGLDNFTINHLYSHPIWFGQTMFFMPPEAFDPHQHWQRRPANMRARYDIWTVAHVMLEVVLGTPYVFNRITTPDGLRALNLLHHRYKRLDTLLLTRLASFAEFCIFVPGFTDTLISEFSHCADGGFIGFRRYFQSQDPYYSWSRDIHLIRLIWSLLAVDPALRLTADEAMRHAYFQHPSDAYYGRDEL